MTKHINISKKSLSQGGSFLTNPQKAIARQRNDNQIHQGVNESQNPL